MACERVLELVPTFVDDEASESLASAVRKHLIDCADCRVVVQEEKSLRLWFDPIAGEAGRADIVVPEGFAARVTAMAFSGAESSPAVTDEGGPTHMAGARQDGRSDTHEVRRGPRLLRSLESASGANASQAQAEIPDERSSIGFMVGLTAVAAALMVTFTLMLAHDSRLDVGDGPLSADKPLAETLLELEAQNAAELEALKQSTEKAIVDPAAPGEGSETDATSESSEKGDGRPLSADDAK